MATIATETEAGTAADPFDVTRPELYRDDTWHAPFRKLRADAPVHYCANSDFGPYWSVSNYKYIVEVESLPDPALLVIGEVVHHQLTPSTSNLRSITPSFTHEYEVPHLPETRKSHVQRLRRV